MTKRRGKSVPRNRSERKLERNRPAPVEAGEQEKLVQIEKPIYGGAFLAHMEGKAVFVPLTLPGEEVRVRIAEHKRGYATAEVEEIVAAAPGRVTPACRHFSICGGCHYQYAGYETQIDFKRAILRETLERGGVQAPQEISLLAATTELQSWGYRNRIRLALDESGNPGYRGRRSHAVIPIAECPIAAPLLVEAARSFAEVVRSFSRLLRPTEISLFCDGGESSLLASVFTTGSVKGRAVQEGFGEFSRAFAERIGAVKGVELVEEGRAGERGQTQSPRTVAQWGEPFLAYHAAGFDYRVDHGAFFQVNRWLVDGLVDAVTAEKKGAVAWDLFAGVGLFARRLTESFARVIAVESAPPAVAALKENLHDTTGTAVSSAALDFLHRNQSNKGERPDLIVVDPPRTGLGAEITGLLVEVGAPELTYVSCDPATLARDLRALLASGYEIQSTTLADLFPQTFHLETVVHMRRS
jgi:23S rRNA (uracil1939-C5)-methyltransferase